jgi:hypothetical protein
MQIDLEKITEDSSQVRTNEVRSLQSPLKSPAHRLRTRKTEKKKEKTEKKNEKNFKKDLKEIKEKTGVKGKFEKNDLKERFFKEPFEFRWFDIRDSKELKGSSQLSKFPRSFKKVREMIRTKGLVNCGENTEEDSLVGWTVDRASEYLTEESRLNLN